MGDAPAVNAPYYFRFREDAQHTWSMAESLRSHAYERMGLTIHVWTPPSTADESAVFWFLLTRSSRA